MATVSVVTATKVYEIEANSVTGGVIEVDGDLILEKPGGVLVNLGNVKTHSDLIGLDQDHHTQYALADGSRGEFATVAQGEKADAATPVLVLGPADPVPGGTAAGTVIVRTT